MWQLEEELLRQEEAKEQQLQQEKERNLKTYLLMLLEPLVQREQIKVSEILDEFQKNKPDNYQTLISQMDFYPFLIQLHQLGLIPLLASWELETYALDDLPRVLVQIVDGHQEIHALKGFELMAVDEVIYLPNGYVMSDFIVLRRNPNGMA